MSFPLPNLQQPVGADSDTERQSDWRDHIWAKIDQPWDLLVVGGGITGAGIFREATRAGLHTLLVDVHDWAWGTSSRSSKFVHGGFRYLSQGNLRLVRESARERRRLLSEGQGLIAPLGFMLASYRGDSPPLWANRLALVLYDLLAGQWDHASYTPDQFRYLAPHVAQHNLDSAMRGVEATVDDARLVLRLIREGVRAGGVALNYTRVAGLLGVNGQVAGASIHDLVAGRQAKPRARVVVNATCVWVDQLRAEVNGAPKMRPLRGSHLIFPAWRLPLAQAVAFRHPLDGRCVTVAPWEDVTIAGTTDLDHRQSLDDEPAIEPSEVAYLMAAVTARFPALGLTLDDVIATYSGVRPVVDTGRADSSKESREHLIHEENGLITVMGGKLTTFRPIARDTLMVMRRRLPNLPPPDEHMPALDPVPQWETLLPPAVRSRLLARHGADASSIIALARPGELEPIGGTTTLGAELRWAARHEQVIHLDDLLLRRVRIGLQLPEGGAALLAHVRAICQAELGWDDTRCAAEEQRYLELWRAHYSLPDRATIPDWQRQLRDAETLRQGKVAVQKRAQRRRLVALIAGLTAFLVGLNRRRVSRSFEGKR